LVFSSDPGAFAPADNPDDVTAHVASRVTTCAWASGTFMSAAWEPRLRELIGRASSLQALVELLEHRHYEIELAPREVTVTTSMGPVSLPSMEADPDTT
jgi:hypothetical protein